MSTATPTPADWAVADPFIAGFKLGAIDRREYWHGVIALLKATHPDFGSHDATRVARIMAPFPLRDDRFAPR